MRQDVILIVNILFFNMSVQSAYGKKPVIILQNLTLQEKNSSKNYTENATSMDYIQSDNSEKENKPNNKNTVNRRKTASAIIFDEEPVFSDSDEEKEYTTRILASQDCYPLKETCKKLDVGVQCTLFSDDLQILDIINKCANCNPVNGNQDFNQLINLCKQLKFKYKHLHFQKETQNDILSNKYKQVQSSSTEILDDLKTRNLEELMQCTDREFYPSRSNINNGFISEACFNSGVSHSPSIPNPEDSQAYGKHSRRSSRMRRQVKTKCIGVVMNKNKIKLLEKSKNKNVVKKKKVVSKTPSSSTIVQNKENQRKGDTKDVRKKAPTQILKEENVKYIPTFDKRNARSLARSWMKPNRSLEVNYRKTVCGNYGLESLHHNKTRRLYSPEDWLQSQEFFNLVKINE